MNPFDLVVVSEGERIRRHSGGHYSLFFFLFLMLTQKGLVSGQDRLFVVQVFLPRVL